MLKRIGKGALKIAPFAAAAIPFVGPAVGAAISAGTSAASAASGMVGGGSQSGKNTGTRERMAYLQNKQSSKKLDKQETGELAQLEAAYRQLDEAAAAQQAEAQQQSATGGFMGSLSGIPPIAWVGIGLGALLVLKR